MEIETFCMYNILYDSKAGGQDARAGGAGGLSSKCRHDDASAMSRLEQAFVRPIPCTVCCCHRE